MTSKRGKVNHSHVAIIFLNSIGLGSKTLSLPEDGDVNDIHEEILDSYPQLCDAGGFELLRVPSRGRSELEQIPSPVGGYTTGFLKDVVKQARIYIRPIQKDLSLEPASTPLSVSGGRTYYSLRLCQLCCGVL